MPTVSEYEASRSLIEEIEKRFKAGKVKEAKYLFNHLTVASPHPAQDNACAAYVKTQYDNLKTLLFSAESNCP